LTNGGGGFPAVAVVVVMWVVVSVVEAVSSVEEELHAATNKMHASTKYRSTGMTWASWVGR